MAKPHLVFKTQYGDRQQTKMVVMLVKAAAAKTIKVSFLAPTTTPQLSAMQTNAQQPFLELLQISNANLSLFSRSDITVVCRAMEFGQSSFYIFFFFI